MGFGLSATGIFLASLVWSAANDPSFVLFESYLSDLGVGPEASVINAAMVTSGLLTVPFAVLGFLPAMRRSVPAVLAAACLCLVGAFAALAGLFTEEAPDWHSSVSVGVFISMAGTAIFAWLALRIDHPLGRWFTELTQVIAIIGAFLVPMVGHPFIETLVVLVAFVWIPLLAVVRLRQLLAGPGAVAQAALQREGRGPLPIETAK
jgi:hypothetical membrane protein